MEFLQKNNISTATPDGKRILFVYLLSAVNRGLSKIESKYPKVLVFHDALDSKKFIRAAVANCADNLAKKVPYPTCKVKEWNSPDMKAACAAKATHASETLGIRQRTFEKAQKALKVRQT